MTPFVNDPDFQLHVGDALETLQAMPDESVHCCVTSPPYWGLRDYGTGEWEGGDPDHEHDTVGARGGRGGSGTLDKRNADAMPDTFAADVCSCGATRVDQQLGLEPTPDEYVTNMVNVFREVRRVLRADGTLWLNIGDSYNNRSVGRKSSHQGGLGFESEDLSKSWAELTAEGRTRLSIENGDMKEKDLVGIPWMLAFALRADGWYLRSDIIWSKPNPMPESVTDRPTKAHEYLFLLTRSPRYFYDADAIREPFDAAPQQRLTALKDQPLAAARRAAGVEQGNPQGGTHVNRFDVQTANLLCGCVDAGCGRSFVAEDCGCSCHVPEKRGPDGRRITTVVGKEGSEQHRNGERWPNSGRNKRSVWEITTEAYPDAHFATFPQALVEPCVKAGCPEWVCGTCGKARERIVGERPESPFTDTRTPGVHTAVSDRKPNGQKMQAWLDANPRPVLGWSDCGHNNYQPGVVLDPFLGSGTTAQVARRLGRRSIGIELNREYAQLAARRLQQLSLFAVEPAEA